MIRAATAIGCIICAACLMAQSAEHKQGVALYQQKNYQEAVTTLQSAAKNEVPDSSDFKESALLIGQSLFMLNQGPKAIPWLEKVGPLNEANYMLGYAYLLNHEPEKSEMAFARLFNQQPDSAGGHLVAGQMLLKQEYENEAENEIKKALAIDPRLPEAHFILGEIAIHRGQTDDGLAEMSKELELNPNFFMAWYRRGDAYTRQDKWDAAVPDLQRAIWLKQTYSGP